MKRGRLVINGRDRKILKPGVFEHDESIYGHAGKPSSKQYAANNMQQFYQLPQATGVAQTQHLNQISYTNGAAQQTTRPSTQL